MAHTEWLPGVRLRLLNVVLVKHYVGRLVKYKLPLHESFPCAVHIEDCEGWLLSGCCGSVAEHWWFKPEVSLVRLPATANFFTLL